MAATGGNPAQLLHIHVHQLAGTTALVAADGRHGLAVEVAQAVQIMTAQHPVDRGRRQVQAGGDAIRADLVPTSLPEDLRLRRRRCEHRRATRPAGAVIEAVHAQLQVPVPPLGGALAGDGHRLGGVGDRDAGLDPPAEQQSALGRQRGVTVTHEDLRVGELASTPAHLQPEVFLVVDPYRVTKVHERYT